MYKINPLNRNVLITADEVLFHGPTSHTADHRMIDQAIIIAEERFIKKSICKDLYEDFRNQKNAVVSSSNIATLTAGVNLFNNGEPIVLQNGNIVNALELVTNSWYVKLWNEYLWKICAEVVIYTATPTNFSEYTSQGEMINNPKSILNEGQGATSAGIKEVQWKMDKILMDRIDPLIQAMHDWICENKTEFPKYCKPCACSEDGVSYKRKSGWIHNIY
ncbi:MAG: hypothetical protein LC112_14045, partial [Flavobacteriales bacterium]|nr:hypothetical protein [Flavobacteriales bacterium]